MSNERKIYSPAEIRYAAYARCRACHAGMAYPLDTSLHGSWSCSTVLTDASANPDEHDEPAPFAFYEIKSEDQPSANGATTRPPGDAGQADAFHANVERRRQEAILDAMEKRLHELTREADKLSHDITLPTLFLRRDNIVTAVGRLRRHTDMGEATDA